MKGFNPYFMKSSLTLQEILDRFYDYLISSGMYSNGTCKCYVSNYTKPAIEKILAPWFDKDHGLGNPFETYNQSKSNSVQQSLIISISDYLLNDEFEKLSLGKSRKTIQNWKSGIHAFFAFLEDENYYFDFDKKKFTKLKNSLIALSGSVSYSKDDLFRIFESRIITQDRAYKNMIYPARLLNVIFNNSHKKNDYKRLLAGTIDNTAFKLENGTNEVKLNEISFLKIDFKKKGGNVSIQKANNWYAVFTEKPTGEFETIRANGISDLSLDHDAPLQNILDTTDAHTNWPFLHGLSDIYARHVNGGIIPSDYLMIKGIRDFKTHSPKCYLANKAIFDTTFVDGLFADLIDLYRHITFSIMLGKYNSSKGKGLTKQSP